jgi:NTE family protein
MADTKDNGGARRSGLDTESLEVPPACRGVTGDPCIENLKRILYFAPSRERGEAFFDALSRSDRCRNQAACIRPRFECRASQVCWVSEHDPVAAVGRLKELYISLLMLDFRWSAADGIPFGDHVARGMALLDELDDVDDLETRYGFHRIMVLVSGPSGDQVDRLITELGARGVGTVLRTSHDPAAPTAREDADFAGRALEQALDLILHPRTRQRALCAAGGGITGIFFELGALKCLDDCMSGNAVNTFDMYFGISAGAVVVGLLAVGYSVDEIMAALVGAEGGRIPPFSLQLLRLEHLNYQDFGRRLRYAARAGWTSFWSALRRRRPPALDSLLFEYSDVIGPPFHAKAFERQLHDLLTVPGTTDDFHRLPRPLYIGASDQDTRQHALFGSDELSDVPISRAISASLAINPAFAAVAINGRYYEDGAVTRTSNFAEAIRRGAGLIFVLDPFVPYVSKEAGFAKDRGLLYNIDQDIRTVSYTRFENTRNWILRKHPEVSSYTFLPSNTSRQLLSVNPMDHRPYLEIWRGAYRSSLQRLKHLGHRLRGDLRAYGISFELERAEAIVEQLDATRKLSFADFFVDRKIQLRQPKLCLDE